MSHFLFLAMDYRYGNGYSTTRIPRLAVAVVVVVVVVEVVVVVVVFRLLLLLFFIYRHR